MRREPGATRRGAAVILAAAMLLSASLAGPTGPLSADRESKARPAPQPVILSTTSSTYDTGLLDALLRPFESESGYRVKVISAGSGQALALGERGEADLVLAHAPEAEERFMAGGAGILRRRMMYNDFVLVGPPGDPAGARRTGSAAKALSAVARSGSVFVSRGDDSGTHQLEKKLWAALGLKPPTGETYLETGQGMGATLRVASQKKAYTLTDRGTLLSQKQALDLEIVFEGDAALRNVYHLMVVNPANGPRVNAEGARALARYLLSPRALAIVRDFGRDRFGQPLFYPDAEPYEEE